MYRWLICSVAFLATAAAPAATPAVPAAVINKDDAATYIFTEASRYVPRAWMDGRDRFPSGAALRFFDGASRRPVVPGFYASSDAAISFDGNRVLFAGKRTAALPWQIWELSLTRGTPRQITQGDSDCIRPFYLPEDRIVYTRVKVAESFIETTPLAGGSGGNATRLSFVPNRYLTDDVLRDGRILFESGLHNRELFTVYPDGTGVETLRCDHGPDRGDAHQISSGDVIFSSGAGLARFTSSMAMQLADVPNVSGPIAEITPERWIVNARGKSGRFGLYRWDGAAKQLSPLDVPPKANSVEPVMIASRIPPKRFPSGLVPTRTTGNLLCLNARISRTPMPGAVIQKMKIYTQDSSRTTVLLGETTVEPDGSFFIQVPADKPLRMELLDAFGRAIRAEHDWFWMRPSEQRICVGCHAGPERAPENKVPEILLKTTVPVKMLEAK